MAFTAGLEGHVFVMGLSEDSTVPELQKEGSNNNSTGILFSRGDHGDRAKETARAQKQRKVRSEWSKEQTQQLLDACAKLKEEKGRACKRRPKWQAIAESVNGKNAVECRRRMETLTKSVKEIEEYGVVRHKQFSQQTQEDFKSLKLATKMEPNWYYLLFKIKEQPQNTMRVSSPESGDRSISSSSAPAAVMPFENKIGSKKWNQCPNQRLLRSRARNEAAAPLGSKFGHNGRRCPRESECRTLRSHPVFFFSSEQAGPHDDIIREVVGTPDAASPQDRCRQSAPDALLTDQYPLLAGNEFWKWERILTQRNGDPPGF